MRASRKLCVAVAAGICVAALAAAPSPTTAADEEETKTKQTPAEKSKKAADPFAVPRDASAGELLEFIERVRRTRVRSLQDYRKLNNAVAAAAEAILEQDADEKTELEAIKAKFNALSALARIDRRVNERLQKFAESFKDDARKEVRALAGSVLLKARIGRIGSLEADEQKDLIAEIARTIEADARSGLGMALEAGRGLERAGRRGLAAEAYKRFAAAVGKSDDERIARFAEKLEGSARRATLPGNRIDIRGTTLDGEQFDWNAYKGKVVLIDFWATWCGPCIAELPNVKRHYETYHDKGFEVVGISLDRSRDALEKFVKEKQIPWTNLFEVDDPDNQGWDHPLATHYGVMSIPTVILVNRDGKVVSLNARGRELGVLLAKLLGPPDEKPEREPEKKDQ